MFTWKCNLRFIDSFIQRMMFRLLDNPLLRAKHGRTQWKQSKNNHRSYEISASGEKSVWQENTEYSRGSAPENESSVLRDSYPVGVNNHL